MKILTVTTLILATAQFVTAQEIGRNSVTLTIDTDSLQYEDSGQCVSVPFTFHNGMNDIVVYGFPSDPHPVPFAFEKLCSGKDIGTGLAFAVFRPDGTQENYRVEIVDYLDQKPVTRGMLDSLFKSAHERFAKTKRVLLKNEAVSGVKAVQLADFLLEPGVYLFQLAYYSGENIFHAIGPEETKKVRSNLFQGCIMSNKVPFVVK